MNTFSYVSYFVSFVGPLANKLVFFSAIISGIPKISITPSSPAPTSRAQIQKGILQTTASSPPTINALKMTGGKSERKGIPKNSIFRSIRVQMAASSVEYQNSAREYRFLMRLLKEWAEKTDCCLHWILVKGCKYLS